MAVSFWRHDSRKSKQLLDDVEHNIVNYQHLGLSYLPRPKAEADNTDAKFDNPW